MIDKNQEDRLQSSEDILIAISKRFENDWIGKVTGRTMLGPASSRSSEALGEAPSIERVLFLIKRFPNLMMGRILLHVIDGIDENPNQNIFFIISLIFVALRTVLGIHAAEAKKTIGFVIIFGLLINFSLFFTEVVLDDSNILAKVFYNSMTVDTKTGSSGQAVDEGGQKSISQALVSKFNPQNLMSQEVYDASEGTIKYVVITLALIAIALFTAMIFFTVGLLFLLRIVTLWIAMIFSPIAFASFATPFKIPGMGHEEWWKDLSQAAFMAPMFVFFLYIIIMFANVMQSVGKAAGGTGGELPQMLLGTIIPFLILYGLLSKAKTTAVKMSGEFGEMVAKAGKAALLITEFPGTGRTAPTGWLLILT